MAYECANTDRISHLPSEIIEEILNLVPCREAVRTSILSSDWRYKWMSMSDLDFGEVPWVDEDKHAKFIAECLHRHQGPIRKFSVTAHSSKVARKIKHWLKLVSKHEIEEVIVVSKYGSESAISALRLSLNCKKLKHLELSNCLLKVPLTFEGFMSLKVLNLSCIKVKDRRSIESLISKSPWLESISLEHIWRNDYSNVSNITISAPKIKYLSLRGYFKGICLQNSPVLGHMRLHTHKGTDLIKIFGDAPNLFNCKKLTHLDMHFEMLTIPPTFEGFMNLKSLKLSIRKVDRSSIESLISKSPLLESFSYVSELSNTPITISAPKIKYLYLKGDLGSFCLENSPALVDMSLHLCRYPTDCNLIKILGGSPNLEKLTVQDFQRLKFGCYGGVLSTTFSYLKVMTLHGFDLEKSKAIQLLVELLRSAPSLEKLLVVHHNTYSHSLPNEVDSNKEYLVGHCFMKLKVVEMKYFFCKAPHIEFAKFILSSSPILEKLTIGTRLREQAILVNRMLKTFPRASTQVAVLFHNWRHFITVDEDQTV